MLTSFSANRAAAAGLLPRDSAPVAARERETNLCRSTHFSPMYSTALLAGACHRNDVDASPPASAESVSVVDFDGRASGAFSSSSRVGCSRLTAKSREASLYWRAVYFRSVSRYS